MVPLATLDELSAQDVPVKITPELPGVWKWLGTTTLSFEYRSDELNRFPMATEYTVEVPAGTTSAVGGVLPEAVTWTFRTPAPTVQASYPNYGPQRRDTPFFIAFDQNIDPAAVLETITVLAGNEPYALRLVTPDEVAADPQLAVMAPTAREGRWLAFRAEEEFPPDTTVTVNVGPGTPSAEGPLTTQEVQSFSFQTYAPLRITEQYCAYGGGDCPPGSPFTVRFNNPLDTKQVDATLVKAEPEIQGMKVAAYYDSLEILGLTAGRTEYKVTISGEVQDIFGQKLGQDQVLTFQTGNAPSYLTGPQQPLVTLDPSASPACLHRLYAQLRQAARARLRRHARRLARLSAISQ